MFIPDVTYFTLFLAALKITGLTAKNVSVIEFKAECRAETEGAKQSVPEQTQKLSEIGFCLRFMVKFQQNAVLIKTNQISLWMKKDTAILMLFMDTPHLGTDVMFPITYLPREWVSLCLSMRFLSDSRNNSTLLETSGFHKGQLIVKRNVTVNFQGINLSRINSLDDM